MLEYTSASEAAKNGAFQNDEYKNYVKIIV